MRPSTFAAALLLGLAAATLPEPSNAQDFRGTLLDRDWFPAPPYAFEGSRYYTVEFLTSSAAIRALVPPPLAVGADSTVAMSFIRHRVVEPDPMEYLEAYLGVPVSYRGRVGTYMPVLALDRFDAIFTGREVWGFNKLEADFDFQETPDGARILVAHGDIPLMQATFVLGGEMDPPAPQPRYVFNVKRLPGMAAGDPPAFRQLTGLLSEIHVSRLRPAEATLVLGSVPYMPLDRIPILKVVRATFTEISFTLGENGEVLESTAVTGR